MQNNSHRKRNLQVRIFADYVGVNERSKPRGILLTDITLLINYARRKRMKERRRGRGGQEGRSEREKGT